MGSSGGGGGQVRPQQFQIPQYQAPSGGKSPSSTPMPPGQNTLNYAGGSPSFNELAGQYNKSMSQAGNGLNPLRMPQPQGGTIPMPPTQGINPQQTAQSFMARFAPSTQPQQMAQQLPSPQAQVQGGDARYNHQPNLPPQPITPQTPSTPSPRPDWAAMAQSVTAPTQVSPGIYKTAGTTSATTPWLGYQYGMAPGITQQAANLYNANSAYGPSQNEMGRAAQILSQQVNGQDLGSILLNQLKTGQTSITQLQNALSASGSRDTLGMGREIVPHSQAILSWLQQANGGQRFMPPQVTVSAQADPAAYRTQQDALNASMRGYGAALTPLQSAAQALMGGDVMGSQANQQELYRRGLSPLGGDLATWQQGMLAEQQQQAAEREALNAQQQSGAQSGWSGTSLTDFARANAANSAGVGNYGQGSFADPLTGRIMNQQGQVLYDPRWGELAAPNAIGAIGGDPSRMTNDPNASV